MSLWARIKTALFETKRPLGPGIYHSRRDDAEAHVRLHLRIDPGGEGILMVNAARIVHLNQTGAEMARYVIEGWEDERIVREIGARYRASKKTIAADLKRLRETVEMLAAGDKRCPITYLGAERADPYTLETTTPYRMDIALTYGCDNACPHCYNEKPRDARPLDVDGFKQVISKLWGIGVPHICFTGGEPTEFEALPELISYAEELGVITGLLTNGRRLSDRSYMEALAAAGLDHVQITIHSARPEVHDAMVGVAGAHAQTVEGIKNAVASPLYVVTNSTLTKQNASDPEELVAFLAGLGVTNVAANGIINAGCAREVDVGLSERELGPILERMRGECLERDLNFIWYTPTEYCRFNPLTLDLGVKQCTAAKYNMCVEPNGDVIPCQSFYLPLGNILRDPWDAIYNHDAAREIRERRYAPEKCQGCPDLPLCGAGCPLAVKYDKALCCGDSLSNAA